MAIPFFSYGHAILFVWRSEFKDMRKSLKREGQQISKAMWNLFPGGITSSRQFHYFQIFEFGIVNGETH